MKPTHTAGPWEEISGAIFGKEYAVATTCNLEHIFIDGPMISAANARLIAAAPDLLEILKNIQWSKNIKSPLDGKYHHCCPWCERTMISGHVSECHVAKAIKKATGEA